MNKRNLVNLINNHYVIYQADKDLFRIIRRQLESEIGRHKRDIGVAEIGDVSGSTMTCSHSERVYNSMTDFLNLKFINLDVNGKDLLDDLCFILAYGHDISKVIDPYTRPEEHPKLSVEFIKGVLDRSTHNTIPSYRISSIGLNLLSVPILNHSACISTESIVDSFNDYVVIGYDPQYISLLMIFTMLLNLADRSEKSHYEKVFRKNLFLNREEELKNLTKDKMMYHIDNIYRPINVIKDEFLISMVLYFTQLTADNIDETIDMIKEVYNV